MGFMRAKTSGFDAIFGVTEDPWRAIVVRGDRAARITQATMQTEGLLTNVYDNELKAIPEPFASCSDGAFEVRVNAWPKRTVFLAGDQCLYWVWGKGAEYQGPITGLPGFGEHIPADYRSDVDAVMCLPNVPYRTMLFKGNQCAIIEWGPKGRGCYYVGPLTGLAEKGWSKLPADMSGDFDHAAFLGGSAGWYHTLLIKGDKALTMNWDSGPVKVGTYAEVAAGLGALPANYRKLRLPAAGRFSGTTGGTRVELRVDLEGELPVVSGDVFTDGDYRNSFVLEGTEPLTLPATLTGVAKFAFNTSAPLISVQVDKLAPGGVATLTRSAEDETNAITYTCSYVSRFLRTIEWEVDAMAGTQAAGQYATTTHPRPPGLAKKIVTVQSAYADVGIEVRTSGTVNEVPVDETGQDLKWSDAELHAAMVSNFSGHRDTTQWKLWSLVATRYVDKGVRGTMFDSDDADDSQRHGVAMFSDEIRDQGYAGTRMEIRTYVHEIGHALNLIHSVDKNTAVPPQPLGPRDGAGDVSWMNYVDVYQGPDGEEGEEAFWRDFTYQFTGNERRHLRHGFYYDIVPGGSKFGTDAADRPALKQFTPPPPSRSGLKLELSGRQSYSHGEPVVAEIKLSLDGSTSQAEAFPGLSPRRDSLTILVTDPAGAIRPFRPLARSCGSLDQTVTLNADTPALYDSAYIGYGAGGLTFPEPGTYRLRALYRAPDHSTVTSPELTIDIQAPTDETDQKAGDLLRGSQQGTLLALLGSDAPQLAEGNAALDALIATYPDHPLAVYALTAKGTNAGRHFLTLTEDGIGVRPADTDTSIAQLGEVVATTLDEGTDAGVDNITLNATMRRLARAHARGGDIKEADAVLDQLVEVFRDKHVPDPVLATITEQAEATRTELHEQA
ncbi:hypothetical protein OG339_19480 [Streptosporangium sp. NBC_01495]|uniref:hypothetical protein n=1 Tax=Streptosporangium sp. NBC_01495 TaxID=2903899 RepID=UPI002E37B9A1|nr:hypothetical protein [Streptosporangium sp. NBC_01495]